MLRAEEELIQKSLENTKNYSKNLKSLHLNFKVVSSHWMVSIVCGCFQSGTVERLEVGADRVEVRIHYMFWPVHFSTSQFIVLLYRIPVME